MSSLPESNRAAIIGRVALWSATIFLACGILAFGQSILLALGPTTWASSWGPLRDALVVIGAAAFAILFVDLEICYRFLVAPRLITFRSLDAARVHVGLTALNDEEAIASAVRDFKENPRVDRLVVVDNGSTDGTVAAAERAGADLVVSEARVGYGSCCQRALAEAATGADVIILCEGDMTFSGRDVAKLLAYLENCDLVLGTRATQELREPDTQMDWAINPINQIVAKLAQIRFWGTRLTDVGCTYRAMRVNAYHRLAPTLTVNGSHFSPHMFIEALKLGMPVIEVPVVFKRRVGQSKGVGANKIKAARVAVSMLRLIYTA